jgi:hypothetical protein
MMKKLLPFVCHIILLFFANKSLGQIYVKVNALGPTHDGTSWATAFQDLQVAMDAAAAGTEIWIAAGTYFPSEKPDGVGGTDDRDKAFHLNKDLKLYGGFEGIDSETMLSQRNPATNKVILSGDFLGDDVVTGAGSTLTFANNTENAYHVFITTGLTSAAIFDGLNFVGAYGSTSVTFTYSGAEFWRNLGGGQHNISSSPTITNCNMYHNYAAAAGAGQYNQNASNPTLTNCNMYNNRAYYGGGQYNELSSSPTLTNCNIYGNMAVHGGGQGNDNSSPTLTNCNIYGNSATIAGGGQFNSNSSPTLTNCNFYNNSATNMGGGQYNISSNISTSPTIKNSIFWANQMDGDATVAGADIQNEIEATPTITYSITQVYSGTGTNKIADPLFVDADNGDFRLQAGSPAIDAGTASGAPATDFAGTARPQGAGFDMGAYEYIDYTIKTRLYVDIDATGANNGLTWADAFNDLQTAMDKGILNTTTIAEIWIAAGTYLPTAPPDDRIPDARDKAFHLDKNLKIYGGFAGTETLLSLKYSPKTGQWN